MGIIEMERVSKLVLMLNLKICKYFLWTVSGKRPLQTVSIIYELLSWQVIFIAPLLRHSSTQWVDIDV